MIKDFYKQAQDILILKAFFAIRSGVDVFTLSATLGHSSTGTTSHYVLAEPGESSSLKLG